MEYLTNLYNTISGDPLIIIILLAILLFVGYAIVKKLFKVAVFVVLSGPLGHELPSSGSVPAIQHKKQKQTHPGMVCFIRFERIDV